MSDHDQTIDDALEEDRNHSSVQRVEPLVNDFGTPASPPDDQTTTSNIKPNDHPSTDSNLDEHEVYEGDIRGP